MIRATLSLLIIAGSLLITACETLPSKPQTPCQGFVDSLQQAIEQHTYFDPSLVRIPDRPFLRSNRFLASFAGDPLNASAYQAWQNELRELGVTALITEAQRLPDDVQRALLSNSKSSNLADRIHDCSRQQMTAPRITPGQTQVADSYSTTQRFFGIYPLLSRLAQSSIEEYRESMTTKVAQGPARNFANSTNYQPSSNGLKQSPPANTIASWLINSATQHPLGIPKLKPEQTQHLFRKFAPELVIEKKSQHDQIGALQFTQDSNQLTIVRDQPTLYTFTSYTRWNNQILLQLNYSFWFSQRPPQESWDIYAGNLDGIIWRVTLNDNGTPLLYDSIHQCGCYHKLFLPEGTEHQLDFVEGDKPLAFSLPYQAANIDRLQLKIEASTHYLIAVTKTTGNTASNTYQLKDYSDQLALMASNQRESAFGASGIIEQSARLERWLLWPLGVPSAGAMRQSGLHAIAFVGKRHFDDAYLLDEFGIAKSD